MINANKLYKNTGTCFWYDLTLFGGETFVFFEYDEIVKASSEGIILSFILRLLSLLTYETAAIVFLSCIVEVMQ